MRSHTLSGIKLPIDKGEKELRSIAEKKLGGKAGYFEIIKKSLDARDKNKLHYVYTIAFGKVAQPKEENALERLSKEKLPQDPVFRQTCTVQWSPFFAEPFC